ncbi:unnamed protein product [Symbiodinium natans]|uniref:RRM domain-containing protein n=1 Tax=Symbiodinium natans TaxID=878477 RepID=A0A812H0M2_9DINO|nr:unnamed protein product [Symbiodinium natans]
MPKNIHSLLNVQNQGVKKALVFKGWGGKGKGKDGQGEDGKGMGKDGVGKGKEKGQGKGNNKGKSNGKDKGKGKEGRQNDGMTVMVKGLAWKLDQKTIEKDFCKCGEVVSCRVPKNQDGNLKGFAFIEFKDEEGVKQALDFNQIDYHGRTIFVNKAGEGMGKDGVGKGKEKGQGKGEKVKSNNTKATLNASWPELQTPAALLPRLLDPFRRPNYEATLKPKKSDENRAYLASGLLRTPRPFNPRSAPREDAELTAGQRLLKMLKPKQSDENASQNDALPEKAPIHFLTLVCFVRPFASQEQETALDAEEATVFQ